MICDDETIVCIEVNYRRGWEWRTVIVELRGGADRRRRGEVNVEADEGELGPILVHGYGGPRCLVQFQLSPRELRIVSACYNPNLLRRCIRDKH